ncbi:C2 domain-containing protein [Dichotomocladium elegans]|nr:C2 domain-containing protein [Dichotomocladium elegans]
MPSSQTLRVTVHSARDLIDVEHGGKNDPYLRLYLDPEDSDAFQRTEVKKDAGAQAAWNETFEFGLNGHTDLYVEVMDAEKGVDELVGFATIALNQAPINGLFELFNVTGKVAGIVHLTIGDAEPGNPVQGRTYAKEEQLKRVKNLRNKGVAGDVGAALLAGAFAAGAGFLGQKYYKSHNQDEGDPAAEN